MASPQTGDFDTPAPASIRPSLDQADAVATSLSTVAVMHFGSDAVELSRRKTEGGGRILRFVPGLRPHA